mgnify:FL=1|jgi:hypothetical protein
MFFDYTIVDKKSGFHFTQIPLSAELLKIRIHCIHRD